ncbi:biogenesis of lysosome-related organelles complex 1 subunit 2 [Planococcus citri]|uniref:biogenesis of lysosome-related organelles complex 1 subunit 2 n=1 Tax=Planococcus citri TaxID=170843 RepID=UPI0031FA0409
MAEASNQDNPSTEEITDSPKKGPTLSTSTSSFEPLDPHDPNLSRLANALFEKTSEYLLLELNATQEDYELLTNMNNITATKYSDMRQIATKVSKQVQDLNNKYKKLSPLLEIITQLQSNISKLEEAAYKLDAYAKKLEDRYKILEKRYNTAIN